MNRDQFIKRLLPLLIGVILCNVIMIVINLWNLWRILHG
jgi:hypothetical protein